MAVGMDSNTGRAIDEAAHIQQCIANILATRLVTLVMRRDYGSRQHEFVDDPLDAQFVMEVQMAGAEAIRRWEDRVTAERVQVTDIRTDGAVFRLELRRRRDGQRLTLTVTV